MNNTNWIQRPIGELFKIGAGKTMSVGARNTEGKTKFLRTANVFWDEIDLSTIDEMYLSPDELRTKLLRYGDLLVCEGGDIGRSAIWEGQIPEMSFQNHLHRLRPKDKNINPRFYVYFLQCAFTQLGIFEGAGNKTTIPNLSRNRLADLLVPQPTIEEQNIIADALLFIRISIRIQERCIGIVEELKRAAMRELFTRGLHGEAQKETEIGLVPESWEICRLGDHFELSSGGTPSRHNSEYWDSGTIPWVKTTEIDYKLIITTEECITQKGLSESAAKILPAGTLLMAMYGQGITRGKVAILGINAACNQACAAIIARDDIIFNQYLYHFFSYQYEQIRKLAHGGQQQNLNLEIVRSLAVAFPPTTEQREIVEILDAIDRKIELHKKKKALLEELFKSLLHKLMTGEIRVADLELSAIRETED
ncbi:MAG: restriction endonuclease subunit S [Spirochaetes bacterium]|nr:restriction endonuclease subunit S [Spirochaetota bacterium]